MNARVIIVLFFILSKSLQFVTLSKEYPPMPSENEGPEPPPAMLIEVDVFLIFLFAVVFLFLWHYFFSKRNND